MPTSDARSITLVDGSRLITEACVRAGADVYVGYPITPANWIYTYSSSRFPGVLAAPDEITVMQWMAGLSAGGHLPVTATSFPGLALMIESINMAFMMELPMLIIMAQRLGPSTGSATVGAQGDLLLLHGIVSGGYSLPTFSISSMIDCWEIPPVALKTAVDLRSPVILLASKETLMTQRSFNLGLLNDIMPIQRRFYEGGGFFNTYDADGGLVPPFLPVGNDQHQVRLNASTHDKEGIIASTASEALQNSQRLGVKIDSGTPVLYDLDEQAEGDALVVSYGVSAGAAQEAVEILRTRGKAVSLLIAKTLLPVPLEYSQILERYERIVIAEENSQGQLAQLLFGKRLPDKVSVVNKDIGRMVAPAQIIQVVSV